jgi:tetratricopeptide (TPR) repeat protein
MSQLRNKHRRRLKPQSIVAAAAASVVITSHALSTDAAFYTPSFSSRRQSSSPLSTANQMGALIHPNVFGIRRRGSLHQSPFMHMSSDELLQRDPSCYSSRQSPQQQQFLAFQNGSTNYGRNTLNELQVKQLGSLSGGQYGGFQSKNSYERRSSLSVSQSSSDNVLGFQIEDFGISNDDHDLHFSVEDFEQYQDFQSELEEVQNTPVVRTLNPRLASSTQKRVAASLLRNGGRKSSQWSNASVGSITTADNRASRRSKQSDLTGEKDDLPPWFPWLPTQSQIMRLKVVELRAACAERGLIQAGKKAELQRRLLIWATVQDRKRVRDRLTGLKQLIERSKQKDQIVKDEDESYDVGTLTSKRKAMTKEKRESKHNRGVLGLVDQSFFDSNSTLAEEFDEDEDEEVTDTGVVDEKSISRLSRSFNAPSSKYSNREVREMYVAAKIADQAGNRQKAKSILAELREATPHDMRVVRRLARMEEEDGNVDTARELLQQALCQEPHNAHLLHGLGQLERQAGNEGDAVKYYKQAMKELPTFPNSYHALGTLEHTNGNIKAALTVIKMGLKHCPKNHRLHHALGDIYLDANMLDLAEDSYLAGLQYGPEWGKSFVYTSLSFVSYAKGDLEDSRTFLRQSIEINGGMHAQGVIALAHLEESEGNIQEARKVYRDAISSYEKKRRKRSPLNSKSLELEKDTNIFDTSTIVSGLNNDYSMSYSGDKWINVFKSWARMEEVHGTYETAHILFSKAARLFPFNFGLLIDWARLQAKYGEIEKAALLFKAACQKVGDK